MGHANAWSGSLRGLEEQRLWEIALGEDTELAAVAGEENADGVGRKEVHATANQESPLVQEAIQRQR